MLGSIKYNIKKLKITSRQGWVTPPGGDCVLRSTHWGRPKYEAVVFKGTSQISFTHIAHPLRSSRLREPLLCFMVHNSGVLTRYFEYLSNFKTQENFNPAPRYRVRAPYLITSLTKISISQGENRSQAHRFPIKSTVSSTSPMGGLWLSFQSRTRNIICGPDVTQPQPGCLITSSGTTV